MRRKATFSGRAEDREPSPPGSHPSLVRKWGRRRLGDSCHLAAGQGPCTWRPHRQTAIGPTPTPLVDGPRFAATGMYVSHSAVGVSKKA